MKRGKSHFKVVVFKQIEMARKKYWEILYLKQVLGQYEIARTLFEKNRREAIKRIKSGVATESDKYEFEIKNVELNQDVKRLTLLLDKEKNLVC